MRMKTAEKAACIITALSIVATVAVSYASGLRNPATPPEIFLSAPAEASRPPTDGLVNINTADADALSTLPGIGPALAQRIIAYRETCGAFIDTADIIDVTGIGLKTFANFKDKITV